MADLCAWLGVIPSQPCGDQGVSVEPTWCTGLCDQGPALLINHHQVITKLDSTKIAQIADLVRTRVPRL